jgi:predicted adenine nucleotide alpha hydrolase (AANH) superfamily ATPase
LEQGKLKVCEQEAKKVNDPLIEEAYKEKALQARWASGLLAAGERGERGRACLNWRAVWGQCAD